MRRVIDFYRLISKRNYSTLAGAIAFFFIINGGSIIFLTILFLNYFNISLEIDFSNLYFSSIFENIYDNSYKISKSYSFFFILTSIWSASSLFYHLMKTGEIMYQEKSKKYNALHRIVAIVLLLIFLFILISLAILYLLLNRLSIIRNSNILYKILEYVLSFILLISVVIYINLLISPIKINFKRAIRGSLFTVVSWILITIFFGIYIKVFANFKIIYGALQFVIISMMWIYLLSICLCIGFVITMKNG